MLTPSPGEARYEIRYGRIVTGEQEIARAMFAAVPDAPASRCSLTVEEADDLAEEHEGEVEPLADMLRPEANTDKAGGDAPEQGPLRQPPDEPRR